VTGQQMIAQDVVHDAFMALWRAPEAFDARRDGPPPGRGPGAQGATAPGANREGGEP
jgi:hypothetical protein